MYKQDMSFEDFYDEIWGSIPDSLVSESYLTLNQDCIHNYTYDLYRLFQLDSDLRLKIIIRIVESTFLMQKQLK